MSHTDVASVFFGTPQFAVHILDALKESGYAPTLIVTTPDKPKGRGLLVASSPVKEWAKEHAIDVLQPENIDDAFITQLNNTQWDVFLVASYGKLLPQKLLDIPKQGTLNVHPSLLPKYRGASPVPSQILADDPKTGVTIMHVDEKMDHGPILSQAQIEIDENDWPPTGSELREMLAVEGGKLLAETLPAWLRGEITPEPQDEQAATYSKKIQKKDGEISLSGDARENFLKIRAFDREPGTYFFTHRKGKHIRVKIVDASYKNGELLIERVIPEGKREMSYADFLRG